MLLTAFSLSRAAAFLVGSLRGRRSQTENPRMNIASGTTPVPEVDLGADRDVPLSLQQVYARGDQLPTLVNGSRAVGWWGIMFLVTIEVVVFGSFIASYFYLKAFAPRWPAGQFDPPDLLLPTINTVLLLLIAIPVYWAKRSIQADNTTHFLIAMGISTLMGIGFLVLKYVEYSDVAYLWHSNAYGSIVWTMTGFHVVHVIAVLLKNAGIIYTGMRGYFNARRHVAVDGNTIYWYFVIGIWIPLYLTIYISPRVM